MKKDLYRNNERWEFIKENHFNKTPKGIRDEDWKLLINFLKDMELGLNVAKEKKGKRQAGTLLNLHSHNKLFLQHFDKPIIELTKEDLHYLESKIEKGEILKANGQKYLAFGNYIKDFKVFWNWLLRTKQVKESITEDISSKTNKPAWVYLTEPQTKDFFNSLSMEYKTLCWFFYDSGARVSESLNIRVSDFTKDYKQVTISDDISKTFGRTINLKLSSQLIEQFIRLNNLKDNDFFIQAKPFAINKYLRIHCGKMFGEDNVSNPKAKGLYKSFTLYDIRHNSACYWYNRYPTHKGLMYRFGWRKADKIEYYSDFLGVADELMDSDMIMGEDKSKLYTMDKELNSVKALLNTMITAQIEGMNDMKEWNYSPEEKDRIEGLKQTYVRIKGMVNKNA